MQALRIITIQSESLLATEQSIQIMPNLYVTMSRLVE
jgi:hypothetical protein